VSLDWFDLEITEVVEAVALDHIVDGDWHDAWTNCELFRSDDLGKSTVFGWNKVLELESSVEREKVLLVLG